MSRPEAQRFDIGQGVVWRVYPETWEVDILADGGGIVQRALVVGPRFPEVTGSADGAAYPLRPQWAVYGFTAANDSQPVCFLVSGRLFGADVSPADHVYFEEVLNYRVWINRDNSLEIRNRAAGGDVIRLRMDEEGGVVTIDTPRTRIVLQEQDQSITIECDEKLTVHCNDADVQVDGDAQVLVAGNLTATVGGSATVGVTGAVSITAASVAVTAPVVTFSGNVAIGGNLVMA